MNEHKRSADGAKQPYCGRRGKGVYLTTADSGVNCRHCLKKMFKHGVKLEAWQMEYLHGSSDEQ